MILEVAEGPEAGRRIAPKEGAVVTVGRTTNAMEVFAGDTGMSGLHFAAGLRAGALYLTNLSKTNGSLVNGERIESAALKNGDRVTAGATVFRVVAPPPNPYPAKLRIGAWGLNAIPEGWKMLEGVGLLWEAKDGFQPNAAALEDALPEGQTLAEYVSAQMDAAKVHLTDAEFQGPLEAKVEGAEQAMLLTVRSLAKNGELVLQRQLYALSGSTVGVLTLSVADRQAAAMNPALGEIARGANFHKPPIPESSESRNLGPEKV
jgi:hypothetical protein